MRVADNAPAAVIGAGQLAAIEGAAAIRNDPARLKAELGRSDIRVAVEPGACATSG